MKEALGMELFSLKRLSVEGSFTGDPEDMLRKAPGTGISLQRGHFMSEGNLESGEGFIYRGL